VTIEAWLAFCATELVLCFTPGPAVLLVVSVALGRGMRGGLSAALGILTANTLYFALSAFGIGAVLVASHELFLAVKWAGALYLVVLGLRMIFERSASRGDEAVAPLPHGFARGFVVQGANPKSLIFFTALLPQFLDPTAGMAVQVAILGVSSVLIEIVALAVYAFAASRARRFARGAWISRIEAVGGAFLVAAGLCLAVSDAD
jgi:threonine/homoserine/homoserine lactone efflux protein